MGLIHASSYLNGGDGFVWSQESALFVLNGQSNMVGQGNYNVTESGYNLAASIATVTLKDFYWTTIGPPPVTNLFGPSTLQPYAAAGQPNMGPELTFGRYLLKYWPCWKRIYILKQCVNGSGLALHWLPSSTYPNGGTSDNLYNQHVANIRAAILASGSPVRGMYWEQGWTDASNGTDAGNYQANLGTFFTALRGQFGAFSIVLGKLSPNTAAAFKTTVRAAQVAYVAGDANSRLLPMDPLPLGSGDPHYSGAEQCAMGEMAALNLGQMIKPTWVPNIQSGPHPWVQGYDVGVFTTGTTVTPRWAVEHKTNDIGIMIVAQLASDAAATLTDAQGFTEIVGSPAHCVFSGLHLRLHAYWCRATSNNMTAPTVTTNNTNGAARIFVVRGGISAGNPIDGVSFGTNNANNTAVSIPASATSLHNSLVLAFCVTDGGGVPIITSSGWTNSDLSNITLEQGSDYLPASAHMLIHCVSGKKTNAGAYGATTGTLSSVALIAGMTISIPPDDGSGGGAGATSLSVTITDSADPVITADNFSYLVQPTNTGANIATTISCVTTLDASLTYVSAVGAGWTFGVVGQVVTATRAQAFIGAMQPITINVKSGTAGASITTSVALSASNASTANNSQGTTVNLVTSDGGWYIPQSSTEWANLYSRYSALLSNWSVPSLRHLCQDASGNAVDQAGVADLVASGTGLLYQQTVAPMSTLKALTTTDNGTGTFKSTSASLPDISTTSMLNLTFVKNTSTPVSSRSVVQLGTTRVASEIGNTNLITCVSGANSAAGPDSINLVVQPLVTQENHTAAQSYAFTLKDKINPTHGSPTGKALSLGNNARTSPPMAFFGSFTWTGAAAERSTQDIFNLQTVLGAPGGNVPTWIP